MKNKQEKPKTLKTSAPDPRAKDSSVNLENRPPVVSVMGHIDHGKSTLLDYIRKSNVAEQEAGGITQRISAYAVKHKTEDGKEGKITFIDTPGHEAFSKMRQRSANIADIAILIVSAEDGVKPQTVEAWQAIESSKTPCIVAINKVDKEGANVERTKAELSEQEIFLENYGGNIPFAEISAKTGKGVDELLTLINIMAELEEFKGNPAIEASGFVLESDLDPKRGIQATLIIKEGTIKTGMWVACGEAMSTTRIIENFQGESIKEASFSSPIRVIGFDKIPQAGQKFKTFFTKEEAEKYTASFKDSEVVSEPKIKQEESEKKAIPIILKADSVGTLEVLENEIKKITSESAEFKIASSGAGPITEGDIKYLGEDGESIVIGFNVGADAISTDLAERKKITLSFFDVIYKMIDWLEEEMEKRRPRVEKLEINGKAKILKVFSKTKERQVIGGKVQEGKLAVKENVKILRRDFEVGQGKVVNLQKNKSEVNQIEAGSEFGMLIETKTEISPGDTLEAFSVVKK